MSLRDVYTPEGKRALLAGGAQVWGVQLCLGLRKAVRMS